MPRCSLLNNWFFCYFVYSKFLIDTGCNFDRLIVHPDICIKFGSHPELVFESGACLPMGLAADIRKDCFFDLVSRPKIDTQVPWGKVVVLF